MSFTFTAYARSNYKTRPKRTDSFVSGNDRFDRRSIVRSVGFVLPNCDSLALEKQFSSETLLDQRSKFTLWKRESSILPRDSARVKYRIFEKCRIYRRGRVEGEARITRRKILTEIGRARGQWRGYRVDIACFAGSGYTKVACTIGGCGWVRPRVVGARVRVRESYIYREKGKLDSALQSIQPPRLQWCAFGSLYTIFILRGFAPVVTVRSTFPRCTRCSRAASGTSFSFVHHHFVDLPTTTMKFAIFA